MNEHQPALPASENPDRRDGNFANSLAETLKDADQNVPQALEQLMEHASELARAGMDAVISGSKQAGDQVRNTGNHTLDFVRREPVKAVLIAATLGAIAMALVDWRRHARGASSR